MKSVKFNSIYFMVTVCLYIVGVLVARDHDEPEGGVAVAHVMILGPLET